ncbi:MAG: GtrA family protein [Actinomycetota bacterium]|nr:GtrA family protein [Actinomycetota bacterium]
MLGRAPTRHLGARFARYTLGSVVAVVASETAFVACYGTGLLATTGSSAVAFVAGAIPNYLLNRSWVWSRRGRVRVGREVVLYAVVSAVSFAASAVATAATSRVAGQVTSSHARRTALVAASYLGTYGVLFVFKFVLYQRVIFAGPPGAGDRATMWPGSPGRNARRS